MKLNWWDHPTDREPRDCYDQPIHVGDLVQLTVMPYDIAIPAYTYAIVVEFQKAYDNVKVWSLSGLRFIDMVDNRLKVVIDDYCEEDRLVD